MSEQVGWRALLNNIRKEAPQWAELLPALPRLLQGSLTDHSRAKIAAELALLRRQQRNQNHLLVVVAVLLLAIAGILLWAS